MQTWYLQVQDSEYNVLLLNQEIGNYKKYNKWIEKKIDEIIFRQYPTAKRWEVRTNPYTSRVVMWHSENWHKTPRLPASILLFYIHKQPTNPMLPTHNAILFHSKEEHQAALYDACLLIVNTYNQSDMLDGFDPYGVTSYDFMKFARHILNQIAESV